MTIRTRRFGACSLAVLTVATLALTSCSGSSKPKAAPPTPTSASETPTLATETPTPTPTPTLTAAAVNPLTGLPGAPKGSVIGVKIDDTYGGRPQRGVDQADIVYIEQAEGGLSRLLAVFASKKPTVEAIRSVRASDPELLGQYGAITLVASGGGGDALPTLYRSKLHPVINDRGDKGFSFDNNRSMPYNTMSNLAQVTALVKSGNPVQSIGFTWSPTAPAGGTPATSVVTNVGNTQVTFKYNKASGRYQRYIDGVLQHAADGQVISTPNIIVQFCRVTANPNDVDVNGAVSQYTHTIGTGSVVVFRNGERINGSWSRPSLTAPTNIKSASGAKIALAPGGAWVLLVSVGAPLTAR